MRWLVAALLLLTVTLTPLAAQATSGRAAPTCSQADVTTLGPTTSVGDGECVVVDLGLLQPGDVYDMSLIVVDDAVDLLLFDQNGLQPYELGQSYRSSVVFPASTESALGGYEFHWSVPPSIAAKRWSLVLDNLAHDGDGGLGDQGGSTATVSVEVTRLNQAYWTPYNNLVAVEADDHALLLSGSDLQLDAGTVVVVSAWPMEFIGDVYLQTRTMYDRYVAGGIGVQFLDGAALQSVTQASSFTWQVPASLEGEELLLVVDNTETPLGGGNGSESLRMTVRLEMAPPLTPTVNDDKSGTVSLGETLTLDATATPNRLGQRGSFSWDLDDEEDTNGDGNASNDVDAQGLTVDASWSTPGTRTVHVTMTSPSGEVASSTHQVSVVDTVPPVPRIQTDATPVAGGWRLDVGDTVTINCMSSTDDDVISQCAWTVDGVSQGTNTTFSQTWTTVGQHLVELTVTDASGNVASTNATLRSIDPSLPEFNLSGVAEFPTEATAGDELRFRVVVSDPYDGPANLRVHWDLDPTKDTDKNGDAGDDPDRVGINVLIPFERAGQQDIVITVFDASNNSNRYAFQVDVIPAPTTSTSYTGLVVGVLVLGALMGAGVLGFRFWQRRLALDLLLNRGLNHEDAKAHMAMVAQQERLPLLSKAVAYAGLHLGEVVPREVQEAQQKQAEFDAIYGNSPAEVSTTAFAPPASTYAMSAGSSQAAAEAAALLEVEAPAPNRSVATNDPLSALMDDDDDEQELVPTSVEPAAPSVVLPATAAETAAPSSAVSVPAVALPAMAPTSDTPAMGGPEAGVALPPSSDAVTQPSMAQSAAPVTTSPQAGPTPPPAPAPRSVRHTCSACSAMFEVDVPAGLSQALVACPRCGTDQLIRVE